jgi:acetyl-CoA acetyltransferase family protein
VKLYDTTLGWRFPNPKLAELFPLEGMGETAENIAERTAISREAQDAFAYESHLRAVNATRAGRFDDEIVPVRIDQGKGEPIWVVNDEHPRPDTTPEKLAQLRPVFRPSGTVTAGNASGINDGAAALLLAGEEAVQAQGLRPLARIVSLAVAGVDPRTMGMGPVPASRKALQRAGLTVDDIGLVELNEAFAVQALACIQELGLERRRVNVNGGAIALGHPLGCSGARILTTLVHEMAKRPDVRYGLATMCIGVGQGIATIVERIEM